MVWRWDQGRLEYFRFENIVKIAHTLVGLNNIQVSIQGNDPLRHELMAYTGLPFAPNHYSIWRNYSRVFKCAFLATDINNRLIVTDICQRLAETTINSLEVDEYLSLFFRRFSYPFPAFQDYDTETMQVYPICAVIKFLISRLYIGEIPQITIADVFSYVIGNNCSGIEPLDFYGGLRQTNRQPIGDELRQVRELLIFCSQINFLKWFNNILFLDVDRQDEESIRALSVISTPNVIDRANDKSEQIIRLSILNNEEIAIPQAHLRVAVNDLVFTEGRKVRTTHLRTERSPQLRKIFFDSLPPPFLCDMCELNLDIRYPWTNNILELHHLLPLSSAITINIGGTSLSDVKPLCPNCHKSVHVYYGNFLDHEGYDDFRSRDEALEVYNEAKRSLNS